MKCSSENCIETPELACYCNGEILICKIHFDAHIALAGFTHNVKSIQNTPDPDLKNYYINRLKQKLQSLEKSSNWLINNICSQIEKLENYLEDSLEKIEKEKKVISGLITEIISIEKIPKIPVDDIRSIFTLSTKAGNKKLNKCIEQGSEQQSFDNEWIKIFNEQSYTLQKINLEKLNETSSRVALPEPISSKIGMCALPNKRTFYYGNYVKEKMAYSGITFIIDEKVNNSIQILDSGLPCISSGLIYCNENIYSFGGKQDENLSICQKYDLKENKWTNLAYLNRPSSHISCEVFGKYIVYSGIGTGINAYNISLNSHSLALSITDSTSKLVCNSGNRIVVMENSGKIYESAIFNIDSWSCIGNSLTPNLEPIGYKIIYNKFVYFTLLGSEMLIYQFNIEKLSFSLLKILKTKNEQVEVTKEIYKDQPKPQIGGEINTEENKQIKIENMKEKIIEETKKPPKPQNKIENKQSTNNSKGKPGASNKGKSKQKNEKQAKNKTNPQEKPKKTYKKKEIQDQAKIISQQDQETLKLNEEVEIISPKTNIAEPKYRKKDSQEASRRSSISIPEKASKEESRKENEIYISSKGSKKNYIEQALTLLSREDIREVIIIGSNTATYNAVCIAEVIKKVKGGLFQINELYNSKQGINVDEEIKEKEIKEKGRTTVSIRLSKDPLDPNHYGYQPSICQDASILIENPSDASSQPVTSSEKLPSFYAQSIVQKFQSWRDWYKDNIKL